MMWISGNGAENASTAALVKSEIIGQDAHILSKQMNADHIMVIGAMASHRGKEQSNRSSMNTIASAMQRHGRIF